MQNESEILARLNHIENDLEEQLQKILISKEGFGGQESTFFDDRMLVRNTLRWVLRKLPEPFCSVDSPEVDYNL